MALRLTKKQSLLISLGLLLLFFGIGVAALLSKGNSQIELNYTVENGAVVTLKNFERRKTKNGKVFWELKADSGSFIPKTDQAELATMQLKIFQDDKLPIVIESGKAIIHFKDNEIITANLSSGVKAKLRGSTLISDTADYLPQEDRVISNSPVIINHPQAEITGDSFEAKISTEELNVKKNVRSTIYEKITK